MNGNRCIKGRAQEGTETHASASAGGSREAIGVNCTENTNPEAQREVLDGLPVLVFLNARARLSLPMPKRAQMLGMAEGEWIRPSRRRRFVGTLSRHGGAADPPDRHATRQPLSRHAAGQQMAALCLWKALTASPMRNCARP